MLKKITILFACLLLQTLSISLLAAQQLPPPQQLIKQLGEPKPIKVREPHLSSPSHAVFVDYMGYPIQQIMQHMALENLAQSQQADYYIEFVCADGYVSRIPADKFRQYTAYLVMGRQDKQSFKVKNPTQAKSDIMLGPYYLVWDNKHSAELQKLGAYHWPYQVEAIAIKAYHGEMKPAKLANDYCLTCHQINGDGGKVYPINLAQIGYRYSEQAFMQWVLNPNQVKPKTHMPALNPLLPEAEREEIARSLYRYFNQIPINNP